MQKKLYRSKTDQKIAGVCAGVAEYSGSLCGRRPYRCSDGCPPYGIRDPLHFGRYSDTADAVLREPDDPGRQVPDGD